jgi:hypothetical protein
VIKSIKIKIGKTTIEITPEELEELKRDILELSPEPVVLPPVVLPSTPSVPWEKPYYSPDTIPVFPTIIC